MSMAKHSTLLPLDTMKFVIFIDALDPSDVKSACPEMYEDMKGKYDVGVPRVTPNTVTQAMTGKKREEMQMVRSTPLWEPSEQEGQRWEHSGGDPVGAGEGPERSINGDPVQGDKRVGFHPYNNILTELDDEGVSIFQYGTPFASFVDLENGMSVYDEMNNRQAPEFMNFATPPTQFMEDDWDVIHDCYVSDTVLEFETLKQLSRQERVDATFLGYKHIDHCTHWYFPDCKEALIKVIWSYMKDLRNMGNEVMWWSDHGSQKKEEVFNINKFFHEKGFLDYEIDEEFNKKLKEKGVTEDGRFEEQMQLSHPAVEVDWKDSVAFSTDAFDSMTDVTENATDEEIEEVKEALNNHPAIANCWRKHEKMDEDAENFYYAPELIVERADNVLVLSNIHPEIPVHVEDVPEDWEDYPQDNIGMRPGVHSRYGCFGGDVPEDAEVEDGKIWQLKDIMYDFVNPDEIEGAESEPEVRKKEDMNQMMDELGYM